MRRMRRFWKVLPLLAAVAAACAKSEPVAKSPVDEIVQRNLAARGGKDKIVALQAIRASGTMTASGGRIAKVVREVKRPGLFRLEFTYQGTKSVFANDGKQGWQVAPLQGVFEPEAVAPEVDSAGGVDQRDLEGPLVNWREKGHQVELVGRETLPGGEADKLKVTLKGGEVRYDYVDVRTSQIVRSDVPRTVRGHAVVLETSFADFRDEGGLRLPHRIEVRTQNRPQVVRIVVEKVELNPEIPDDRFRMPA